MSSGLTVKNTFLQLDEDARQKPVPARLLKSSSDPGFDMPDTDNEFEDFSDFRGATDYDKESTAGTTGEDEDGGRECISDPGSMSSSCSNSFTALEKGTAHDNEGSFDWTTAVDAGEFQMSSLREQVERLVLENKRLEESNKQLQDACLAKCSTMPVGPIAAVGTQAAFAAPACFDSCGIDTSQNFMCFAVAMVPQDHLMQPQAHVQMQYSQDCHGGRWGKKSGRARLDSSSSEAAISNSKRTTVMLRNLPNNYSRMMLTDMIDNEGFAGKYDFVYLPMDFSTQACLGYAFVNLMDPADAERFWTTFDGFSGWVIPSKKKCYVSWSDPHQGLQANIERYKNSPVMHESVPDEYKPRLLRDGKVIPFPQATRKVRAPRLRR